MSMLVRGGAGTAGSSLPATATTGQVLQWNGSAWVAATPSASGTTPNATPTVPGLVQLAGDLAGTAAAPTVPALTGKADKAALAAVATSGAYADLTGRPTLAPVATTGSYGDLTSRPLLAAVATSGAYADLTGRPTIPAGPVTAVKTTDNSSTSATMSVDPDLQLTVAAGRYITEIFLSCPTGSAATGNVQLAAPAGSSWTATLLQPSTYPLSLQPLASFEALGAGGNSLQIGALSTSTAGPVTVSWRSATAGTAAILAAGSWMRLTKVA